jgi:hypothetical protein
MIVQVHYAREKGTHHVHLAFKSIVINVSVNAGNRDLVLPALRWSKLVGQNHAIPNTSVWQHVWMKMKVQACEPLSTDELGNVL